MEMEFGENNELIFIKISFIKIILYVYYIKMPNNNQHQKSGTPSTAVPITKQYKRQLANETREREMESNIERNAERAKRLATNNAEAKIFKAKMIQKATNLQEEAGTITAPVATPDGQNPHYFFASSGGPTEKEWAAGSAPAAGKRRNGTPMIFRSSSNRQSQTPFERKPNVKWNRAGGKDEDEDEDEGDVNVGGGARRRSTKNRKNRKSQKRKKRNKRNSRKK
jgi:hypothetical protein